jgi:membrane protein implicated in regulation of membrane protease activity
MEPSMQKGARPRGAFISAAAMGLGGAVLQWMGFTGTAAIVIGIAILTAGVPMPWSICAILA